jgi:hypothetical protein
MRQGWLMTLAKAEGWAIAIALLGTTTVVLGGTLLAMAQSNGPINELWLRNATSLAVVIWTALTTLTVLFAALIGVPTYLVVLRLIQRAKLALVAAVLATLVTQCAAYPAIDQCDISYSARQRIVRSLPASEAVTLQPAGLTCSLDFRYLKAGQWVELSIQPDIIHGAKIREGEHMFKEKR